MIKKKYNILISGASGFIGMMLIEELLSKGHNVYGLVRKNINRFNDESYTNILLEDITKKINFSKNINIDYFYHLAAKTHDKTNNKDEYYRVNVEGLKNILTCLIKLKINKIIMLSSIKVNGEGFLNNDKVYSHNSKENPLDFYGKSKLEAEILLKKFCKTNKINFIIFRPPLVYGAGVKGNLSSLMHFIDKNIPMPIVRTKNLRSLVSLTNLVDALIIIGLDNQITNKTYLIADDKPISVEELYKKIASSMNKKLFLIILPSKLLKILLWPIGKAKLVDKISSSLIIDNTEIKKDTNWKNKLSLSEELKNMIDNRKT